MHPILAERRVLAAYLAIWLVPASLLASLLAGGRLEAAAPAALVAYPLTLVYAFVCLSAWYVCRRAPLRSTPIPSVLANAAGAAVVSSGLWMLLGRLLSAAVDGTALGSGADALVARETPLLFAAGILVYLLAAAVAYAMMAVGDARAAERRSLELQVLAREAELKALRAQVDPHFLFNSLNSIGGLIGSDPAGARRMSVLLGEFLRTSMRLGAEDRVTLAEEVGLALRFLDIERVRFGDRLTVESAVDESVAACAVPPLLLQPLVENAVRHGIGGLVEGGTIRLDARRAGTLLLIAIENPRDPDARPRPGTGVGLDNVRKRLLTHYGAEGVLRVFQHAGSFRVELTLPCPGASGENVPDAR
jgi:two-component system, LytTR family, sensor histidine kinase AlgZ